MALPETVAEVAPPAALWRRWLPPFLLSNRQIAISSGVVAASFLASKILGYGREILIAHAFGTTAPLDAFRAANFFSDMLDSVIAGTTIAAVFIPVFATYLVKDEAARREGWKFASAVLNGMFLLLLVTAGAGILFARPLITWVVAPGFDLPQAELAAALMRIVLLAAIVFGVSGTVTGILHAQNRFVLAALAPPLHNVAIIASLFLLVPRMGIFGLAWGVVIGSLLHLGVQLPALWQSGMRWFATLHGGHGAGRGSMRELVKLLIPRILTSNIVQVSRLIMINLASSLAAGSISALGYAYQLWQFPETLIGTAIAIVVFPRLAARAAASDAPGFYALYRGALLTILALALPSMLLLIAFAEPVVTLLFQRGAFDAASTQLVAGVLQFYALAIVGESALELLTRSFYARHDSVTPMFVTLGAMILRVALMLWWRDTLGAPGLALAYAIGVGVESLTLWLIIRVRPGSLRESRA